MMRITSTVQKINPRGTVNLVIDFEVVEILARPHSLFSPVFRIRIQSGHWIRIRNLDPYLGGSVADPGYLSRISDPTFFHPGSRILKEFKYFNPQKSKKMVSKL